MIDAYVRDRLFADDACDQVESAYREAFADAGGSVGGSKGGASWSGAYPALLAETAGNALVKKSSVSSLLSTSLPGASASGGEKYDGITAVMNKASDFLQKLHRVVLGLAWVLYMGLQRLQIDKSEMKMYDKIAESE